MCTHPSIHPSMHPRTCLHGRRWASGAWWSSLSSSSSYSSSFERGTARQLWWRDFWNQMGAEWNICCGIWKSHGRHSISWAPFPLRQTDTQHQLTDGHMWWWWWWGAVVPLLCVCVNVTAIATTAGSKQRLLCCAPVCSIIDLKFTHCCCCFGTGTHFVMQAFSCLVVYGKIDTAAPIALRVVQALPLLLAARNWQKNQQKSLPWTHHLPSSPQFCDIAKMATMNWKV